MQSMKTMLLATVAIALVLAPQSANGNPQFNLFNNLFGIASPVLNASIATNVAVDLSAAVTALNSLLNGNANFTVYANTGAGQISINLGNIKSLLAAGTATPAQILALVQDTTQIALNLAAAAVNLTNLAGGTSTNLTALFLNATQSLYGVVTPNIKAQLAASIGNTTLILNTLVGTAANLSATYNTAVMKLVTNLNTIATLVNTGLSSVVNAKITACVDISLIIAASLTTAPITPISIINAAVAIIGVKIGFANSILNTLVSSTAGLTVPILASVNTVVNAFVTSSNIKLAASTSIVNAILNGALGFANAIFG